ncbi:MAG: DMT family transporter [Alphaproteobacteria bacterium]
MTHRQAMLCALATYFGWVVTDVAIKLASQAALSPFMIMAVLGTVGVMGIVGMSLFRRNIAVLRPHNLRGQATICLCAMMMNYTTVIALKHLPLTIFYIAVFTSPLAVAALSTALRHEAPTRGKIACLVAGFVGVLVVLAPRLGIAGEGIGYIAASISVAGFVVYTVTIHKISKTDSTQSIQLFAALSVGTLGIFGAFLQAAPAPDGKSIVMLIAAGGINLLANAFYNKALKNTSSTNVAQLHYTQLISGALLGYLIWHEVPTWNLVVGSILIIASGMIVAAQAGKKENLESSFPQH